MKELQQTTKTLSVTLAMFWYSNDSGARIISLQPEASRNNNTDSEKFAILTTGLDSVKMDLLIGDRQMSYPFGKIRINFHIITFSEDLSSLCLLANLAKHPLVHYDRTFN